MFSLFLSDTDPLLLQHSVLRQMKAGVSHTGTQTGIHIHTYIHTYIQAHTVHLQTLKATILNRTTELSNEYVKPYISEITSTMICLLVCTTVCIQRDLFQTKSKRGQSVLTVLSRKLRLHQDCACDVCEW